MYRYLALVWNPQHLEQVRAAAAFFDTSIPAAWTTVYQSPGIKLLRTDARRTSATVYSLWRNGGAVFGKLFEGHCEIQMPRAVSFGAEETHKILATGGRHLVDHYWGAYVAFAYDAAARRHYVFRDPTGSVPCYHTTHRGIELFFSDIEDAVRCLPGPFHIDRNYVTRWLYQRTLANDSTGLDDVKPLPAGECLTLSNGAYTRCRLWDPVAIAGSPAFEQPNEAAAALRSTLQSTVNAWASCYQNITHRLSGGLDSSIVAGCLAQAPSKPQLTYLNLAIELGDDQQHIHTPGMDEAIAEKLRAIASPGDERHYARLVAKRWNVTLVERKRNTALDMQRLTQLPLSLGPAMYFTTLEMDDAKLEMIDTYGTEAFFSGQAGDSVFFAVLQPFPAMDYAHVHGARPSLWPHVLNSARLSRESVWSVLRKTVSYGLLRRRYIALTHSIERPSLLVNDLISQMSAAESAVREAQYVASASLPPGKQLMAQGVAKTAYYDFAFHSGNFADHVNPLDAQPIWELMLRIPTYTVLMDGTNRGLARYAFRDVLPAEIRKRVAKGTGSPFYQLVVRNHRNLLREYLLDGELVKDGYLERRKLDACLAADDPSMIIYPATLLSYLSAEIWLQQWRQFSESQRPSARVARPV